MTLFYADKLSIRLDYESELFQTLTYSEDDIAFLPGPTHVRHPSAFTSLPPAPPSSSDSSSETAGQETYPEILGSNIRSGHRPIVLHFNGGEKRLLKGDKSGWWHKMWWISGGVGKLESRREVRAWARRKVEAGGVRKAEDGAWLSWQDLGCGKEEFVEEIWGKEI